MQVPPSLILVAGIVLSGISPALSEDLKLRSTFGFQGHTSKVGYTAFSPDGKCLASVGLDGPLSSIRIWDLSTRRSTASIPYPKAIGFPVFNPNSKTLATVSRAEESDWKSSRIDLWDVATGQRVASLLEPDHLISSLAFSPDGKALQMVAQRRDQATFLVWDFGSGAKTTKRVSSLAGAIVGCSPDGKTLAFLNDVRWNDGLHLAHFDGSIQLLDAATHEPRMTLRGMSGFLLTLAFTPDGTKLYTWVRQSEPGADKVDPKEYDPNARYFVQLWDVTNGKSILTLDAAKELISQLFFTPDSRNLVSVGVFNKAWDTASGELLPPPRHYVRSPLALGPDGRTFVAAGTDAGNIEIWDVASKKRTATLFGRTTQVTSVAVSPGGQVIASVIGTAHKSVVLWDSVSGKSTVLPDDVLTENVSVFSAEDTTAKWSVKFSADGGTLAVSTTNGTGVARISVYDVATGTCIASISGHGEGSTAVSPDGLTLASVKGTPQIELLDARSGEVRTISKVRGGQAWASPPSNLEFAPDGKVLAALVAIGYFDFSKRRPLFSQQIALWNVSSRENVANLNYQPEVSRTFLAFSHDSRPLVYQEVGGILKVRELASLENSSVSQRPLKTLSADSQKLAMVGKGATIQIWDVPSGKATVSLAGHTNRLTGEVGYPISIQFSPDGKILASVGCTPQLYSGCVERPPDGQTLPRIENLSCVKLWDVSSGQNITALEGNAAAFSDDGRLLVTGGPHGIQLWEVPPWRPREH